jgi:hypothetical protein
MARLNLVAANKLPQKEKAPRNRATTRPVPVVVPASNDDQKDHFITRGGLRYAGSQSTFGKPRAWTSASASRMR